MTDDVQSVPEGCHTVTPYLCVRDAPAAIAFYVKAFGAVERFRLADGDRRVRHAEIDIGDSRLFLTDVPLTPEMTMPGPDQVAPVWLYMYVEDPDAVFEQAVAAGAEVVTPVDDQPWGDRYGAVADPFGYRWAIASRRENVSPEELTKRMNRVYRGD